MRIFCCTGGGEISVPTHRTAEGLEEDWGKMIKKGDLTLGEPCCPHTITSQTIITCGELKEHDNITFGRQ